MRRPGRSRLPHPAARSAKTTTSTAATVRSRRGTAAGSVWETLHNPQHPRLLPSVLGFLRVVETTGCRGADLARLVGATPSAAQATIRYARTVRNRCG